MSVVTCPRCRRTVGDSYNARQGHRLSCVKIPEKLPKGWGVKTRK
jgi:hypothetical protein